MAGSERTGRCGFTVVETMVAVTLLAVGVLALASTMAFITRMIGEGARYGLVAAVGRGTLESLLPIACDGWAHGDTAVGALAVVWTVNRVADMSELRVSVAAPAATSRIDSFATARGCAR
jgi:prepilin-type N-terminal cleavage/methylation domain-containing protein